MAKSVFRKKSLDRINAPEALNDYIRVTSFPVWMVLAAAAVILLGMLAWSIFGRIQITDADGNVKEVAPITFVTN